MTCIPLEKIELSHCVSIPFSDIYIGYHGTNIMKLCFCNNLNLYLKYRDLTQSEQQKRGWGYSRGEGN